MTRTQVHTLPIELWLSIFRHATVTPHTTSLCSTTYSPFLFPTDGFTDPSLKVKYAIVRVCRLWRDLGLSLLYEDALVLRAHAPYIRRALEEVVDDGLVQRLKVRRICLPYSSTIPKMATPHLSDVLSILTKCQSLEVLARPSMLHNSGGDNELFEYPAEPCPPLTSLKRLDWWHHNDAARTGGINSLTDVLQATPYLTYLSLGGEVGLSLMQLNASVVLPFLTTLHLHRINIIFILQIAKWSLPSLQHLIIDYTNIYMLETIAQTFEHRLRTLEFGRSLKFYVQDALHHILEAEASPYLEELSFYLLFTQAPKPLLIPHQTLSTLRLHCEMNTMFSNPSASERLWDHIEAHFKAFCSDSYPHLGRIIFHGNCDYILGDPRCAPWLQKFKQRSCNVEVVNLHK